MCNLYMSVKNELEHICDIVYDNMSQSIDEITRDMASVALDDVSTLLQHDIHTLIHAYHLCAPSIAGFYFRASVLRMDAEMRKAFFQQYRTEATLYARIYESIPINDIIDMMPLIDEYIEYVFKQM